MGVLVEQCPWLVEILRRVEESIFIKDKEGRFLLVNESKARHSGVKWEDMIGETDFNFLPKEQAQKCRLDELRVMETGESIINQEEELTRPDGTKVWVSVSKYARRDDSGEVIGVLGIAHDITEKKKMEKHMAQMIAIVAHDLRTPLVSIGRELGRFLKGRGGDISEEARDSLRGIYKRVIQMERIGDGCLTEASMMASEGVGKLETFDLFLDIINPLLQEFDYAMGKKEIQIDNSMGAIPAGRILVSANKAWLKIVYRNLFSNAIRHTPDGGKIAFGFEDKGEAYHLNVFNTGEPVPSEIRERIFEMFASSASTGIGLAVCRDLILRHGGDLRYEETLDGHPNFIIILPKKEEEAVQTEA